MSFKYGWIIFYLSSKKDVFESVDVDQLVDFSLPVGAFISEKDEKTSATSHYYTSPNFKKKNPSLEKGFHNVGKRKVGFPGIRSEKVLL